MWKIKFERRVKKEVRKIPQKVIEIIKKKIDSLKEDPWEHSKPLANLPFRKVRAGNYRIIIKILPEEETVVVLMIDHRRRIYKRLWKSIRS